MKPEKIPVYCTFYDAPEHAFPGHPESPQRLQHVKSWLQNPPYPEMVWLNFMPALASDVLRVHNAKILQTLQAASRRGSHEIDSAPTYVTEASYHAALMAAGATQTVSRHILSEGCGRGFAIVRPPGHHAEADRPMGFCLLNNLAIAAADAVAHGLGKVAIIDLDAHHGNGIEAIFLHHPGVGYLSLHEEYLYPGSGHLNSTPHAQGRIINVPMPSFANPAAYLGVFQQVVKPWLMGFGAEMLFISAGFDAHFSDPLTSTTLDTDSFYQISKILVELADDYCQSRILFGLEGGYDAQALQDNIQACLVALCERSTYPDHYGPSPGHPSGSPDIEKIIALHQLRKE